jgi:hypothetical protein
MDAILRKVLRFMRDARGFQVSHADDMDGSGLAPAAASGFCVYVEMDRPPRLRRGFAAGETGMDTVWRKLKKR